MEAAPSKALRLETLRGLIKKGSGCSIAELDGLVPNLGPFITKLLAMPQDQINILVRNFGSLPVTLLVLAAYLHMLSDVLQIGRRNLGTSFFLTYCTSQTDDKWAQILDCLPPFVKDQLYKDILRCMDLIADRPHNFGERLRTIWDFRDRREVTVPHFLVKQLAPVIECDTFGSAGQAVHATTQSSAPAPSRLPPGAQSPAVNNEPPVCIDSETPDGEPAAKRARIDTLIASVKEACKDEAFYKVFAAIDALRKAGGRLHEKMTIGTLAPGCNVSCHPYQS